MIAGRPTGQQGGVPQRRSGRRGRVRWTRALAMMGALLILGGGLAVVGVRAVLARYAANVSQAPLLGGAAAPGKSINGAINLLLSGIDERPGTPADGARSDTVMILHVTARHDAAYLVSIPRDTRVMIPAFRQSGYSGGQDKINAAFEYGFANNGGRNGGFQLLALTTRQLTGVSFNGGAIVNFAGFKTIVDAVGGINMCVDEQVTSIHVGWNIKTGRQGPAFSLSPPAFNDPKPIRGMRPQVYHVGCQQLNGWQALDYVRQRELLPDGDYGRQRHQQQFIKALAGRVAQTGLANPLKLDAVLRAAGQSLTFDGNHVPIADWALTLSGIAGSNVVTLKTNGGHFNPQVVNGQDFEALDATSVQLFHAIAADQVGPFVQAHPTVVSTNATAQP